MLPPPPRPTLFPYTTLFRSGILAQRGSDSVIVDVHGVGYLVTVGNRTLAELPAAGDRIRLYTDRKSTRLNSSHGYISYAVFCLKKKKKIKNRTQNNVVHRSF